MLNRRHIRVKVMQSIYAMHQNGSDNLEKEEKSQSKKNSKQEFESFLNIKLIIFIIKQHISIFSYNITFI